MLDHLIELRKRYSKVLEDYMIDILSVMREDTAISNEISQKVLELTTALVSPRNIKEVILFLEKEISRARKMEDSGNNERYECVPIFVDQIHQPNYSSIPRNDPSDALASYRKLPSL